MIKNKIFESYLLETNLSKSLFPVEMFFIKYRAESKELDKGQNTSSYSNNINFKKNNLKKILYAGDVHSLPVGNLSLIISNENLI